ncbi:response regulator transcription factor [Actinocorallia libanotica]|uniref:Response regulator transcription factor n=1 Tax=Actinocorallia libanotica TaxID=46162 RepID=A0ABP4B5D9_9ACTN
MTDIVIIEDEKIVQGWLRDVFDGCDDITVKAVLAHPEQFDHVADLVLLDLYYGKRVHIDAVARLSAVTEVLVASGSPRDRDVLSAIKAGARGYVLKDYDPDRFVEAVRAVVSGEFHLSDELAGVLHRERPEIPGGLTERQWELLGLRAQGLADKLCARRMNISPETVNSMLKDIRDRLGLRTKTDIALWYERES